MIQLNRKPRKGDRLGFGEFRPAPHYPATTPPKKAYFTVTRTPEQGDNLCWILEDGAAKPAPFIWWFEREQKFNQLAYLEEL